MSGTIEVDPQELEDTAAGFASIRADLAAGDRILGGVLGVVGSPLLAGPLEDVVGNWSLKREEIMVHLDAMSESLTIAARRYRETERAVAEAASGGAA